MGVRLITSVVGLQATTTIAVALGCAGDKAADLPPTAVADAPTDSAPAAPAIPAPPLEPAGSDSTTAGVVSDDSLGFSFEYPAGWQVFVTEGPFPDGDIYKVVSLTKEVATDAGEVSVDVEFTVKEAASLEEVAGAVRSELEKSGVPSLDEAPVTAPGADGLSGLAIRAGTPEWKITNVVFFAEGRAYVFKYSSQDALFVQNEGEFDGMVGSFAVR